MVELQVQLLGGNQQVRQNGALLSLQPTIQEFLAFLLLNRHRHFNRNVLADLFWGGTDEKHARRCLSTALWRLRQALEPNGIPQGLFLSVMDSGDIGFNFESNCWLDVHTFEEKTALGLSCPLADMDLVEATALEEAVTLYVGDLFEGLYSDWILGHRERLRGRYVNSLLCLMRYYRVRHAYDQGLSCGQKLLRCEPLREEVYREMMYLYLYSGERGLALRQYERCCQILDQELHIQPMVETQQLYHAILRNDAGADGVTGDDSFADLDPLASDESGMRAGINLDTSSTLGPDAPTNLHQALQQLDQAVQGLDRARSQVYRAVRRVSQCINRDANTPVGDKAVIRP